MAEPSHAHVWVRGGIALVLLAAGAGAVLLMMRSEPGPVPAKSSDVEALTLPDGVTRGDLRIAGRLYHAMHGTTADHEDALAVLAETAAREERWNRALACWQAIAHDPDYRATAALQTGLALIHLRRAAEAEAALNDFLSLAAQDASATAEQAQIGRDWLCWLLSVQLRFEDRAPHLREMHSVGMAGIPHSKQLCFPHLQIWNSPEGSARLNEFLRESPDDPWLNIAAGRYLLGEGRLDEAYVLLEEWSHRPGSFQRAGVAALLECCFERDDWEAFDSALKLTPVAAPDDPWLLTLMRGEHALHRQAWREAVEHFSRLLAADPAHPTACMGLAEAYRHLGERAKLQETQLRSLMLAEHRPKLQRVKEGAPDACEELAAACDRVGLDAAAEVFRGHSRRMRLPSRPALRLGEDP